MAASPSSQRQNGQQPRREPPVDLSQIPHLTGSATFDTSHRPACPLTPGGDGALLHSHGDLVLADASRMYRAVALAARIVAAEDAARGRPPGSVKEPNSLRRVTVGFPPAPAGADGSGGGRGSVRYAATVAGDGRVYVVKTHTASATATKAAGTPGTEPPPGPAAKGGGEAADALVDVST
mmetsp:Transcript_2012/g.4381  ORF Transcript_2012/g.4381 Transcript_2012/m.4381 type:complete len:180 (-) Transcript_2012:346-885(-)